MSYNLISLKFYGLGYIQVKGQKPPAPIRGVKAGGDDNADDQDEADNADIEEASVVDLVPRNDIG